MNKIINRAKDVFKVLFHVSFILLITVLIVQPILLSNASVINSALGFETEKASETDGNIYFNTSYKNMAEVKKAQSEAVEETMKEGAVLLKNKDNTLPLSKGDNVNLYGAASHYSAITGQGSSGGGTEGSINIYTGLKNAGLNVNEQLDEYYTTNGLDSLGGGTFCGGKGQTNLFIVKDIAWSKLPAAKSNEAKVGIMVIARSSGEDKDLYMNVTMDDGSTRNSLNSSDGSDGLALAANEKDVLSNLKTLKSNGTIEKIIVIMNTAVPMQSSFINDSTYDIDACMWVGMLGGTGANAVGKLITGEYTFSGKTVDTFFANSKYNPVYYNFGNMKYSNSGILGKYSNKETNIHYVAYQEGIYNGYKYTETRYEDVLTNRENVGSFDYSKVVAYPFGYGLSYTNFTYSNYKVEDKNDGTYEVSVDVTNNTDVAGKEAVQIYLQKPYTQYDKENGIEKASVELIGFEKVEIPGKETKTVKTIVEEKYFTAYDANNAKTYVIGSTNSADKYLITAAKDSHDAINNILQYKAENGFSVDKEKITNNTDRDKGDKNLVWAKYIPFNNTKYSTNEFITNENENFKPSYEGQKANYGVDKITNQFDNTDFKRAGIFSETEANQTYISRNNWTGTYGKRIVLTATDNLKEAQKVPALQEDAISNPKYDELDFVETTDSFEEIKLIYLRGKDYNDPLWDMVLNRMDWEDLCFLLQDGGHITNVVPSIAAPGTYTLNGSTGIKQAQTSACSKTGFKGFAYELDKENMSQSPVINPSNSIVAATYNRKIMENLGESIGEFALWIGCEGLYGFGGNIHRGAYNGRSFEYYSEDGFLGGTALGHETIGLNKTGTYAVSKHAILNDQETYRQGINVWANEQTIREIYSRVYEIAIALTTENNPTAPFSAMSGFNYLGGVWTGRQGFFNTVFRAEYGMRGYVVSDSYNAYMSPIQGIMNGNDLPDGYAVGRSNGTDYDGNDIKFSSYQNSYGKFTWAMRNSAKNILYTVVNSNAMNGVDAATLFTAVTPTWEIVLPIISRVIITVFTWFTILYVTFGVMDYINKKKENQ